MKKTLCILPVLLVLISGLVYAEGAEARDEKIHRFGTEVESICHELQTVKDPERQQYLEKRLGELINEMNKMGIPTQEQADENREYWLLRSHYAEQEDKQRQKEIQNILYELSPVQFSEETRQMKFQPGFTYPCYWIFECNIDTDSWTYVNEAQTRHDTIDIDGSYSSAHKPR